MHLHTALSEVWLWLKIKRERQIPQTIHPFSRVAQSLRRIHSHFHTSDTTSVWDAANKNDYLQSGKQWKTDFVISLHSLVREDTVVSLSRKVLQICFTHNVKSDPCHLLQTFWGPLRLSQFSWDIIRSTGLLNVPSLPWDLLSMGRMQKHLEDLLTGRPDWFSGSFWCGGTASLRVSPLWRKLGVTYYTASKLIKQNDKDKVFQSTSTPIEVDVLVSCCSGAFR